MMESDANLRQHSLAVVDALSTESLQRLASLVWEKPAVLQEILSDVRPEAEPVLSYIQDLEQRCEIFRDLQRLQINYDQEPLNSTALAIVMVAPLEILQQHVRRFQEPSIQLFELQGFFAVLCRNSVDAIKGYISKGGRPPASGSNTPIPTPSSPVDSPQPPSTPGGRGHRRGRGRRLGSSHHRSASDPFGAASSASPARSMSSSRDQGAIEKAKARDGGVCVVSKLPDPHGIHIFPSAYSACGAPGLKALLQTFWGETRTNEWLVMFSSRQFIESPRNIMSMTPLLHHWFDRARLAFKPLRVSPAGAHIQLHWLKRSPLKPQGILPGDDFLARAGLDGSTNQEWGNELFFHRRSGMPVETGQVFVVPAGNPTENLNIDILQLSWDLLRIAAISGAGEATDEDYQDSDDDSDGGIPFDQLDVDEEFTEDDGFPF